MAVGLNVNKNMLKLKYFSQFSSKILCRFKSTARKLTISDFSINFEHLKDESVLNKLQSNIRGRKGVGNIREVVRLKELFDSTIDNKNKECIHSQLIAELKLLPNSCHPNVEIYKDYPHVVKQAEKYKLDFPAKEFMELAKILGVVRTETLSSMCGPRSYYFLGELVELEQALVKFCINTLIKQNFSLISVPDILPAEVIENCGMSIRGDRSQVYFLDERHGKDLCLSGTAEMALAGLVEGRIFEERELPLLLCAVSRCYRSETSNVAEERGIYRVHQFTKVEMFGVCTPENSDSLLTDTLAIEESIFKALELDFQILDMPLHELGAPAYRKFDIEAWYPGRASFGEISSCSNCTDFQARRLQIKFRRGHETVPVHTVNGTACAIPRMVMALFETHQQKDGSIRIPEVLRPYLGKSELRESTKLPKLKLKR